MSSTYPRLSYNAILALPSPQEGDLAYDLTNKCLRIYIDGKWLCSYQDPLNYMPGMATIVSAGGSSSEVAQDIAVDNNGYVYITGHYQGTALFGASSITSAGGIDIFIAKYNSIGTLQWVRSAGGPDNDYGQSIAVDASGNVYVTGSYFETATFHETTIVGQGGTEMFVVKYNSSGTYEWVKSGGGQQADEGTGITVDISGDVYVAGNFSYIATFGTNTIQGYHPDFTDIFFAKYNSAGIFQWVEYAGEPDPDMAADIVVDAEKNLYIVGSFSDMAVFGSRMKTSEGLTDVFVAKYSTTSATWSWVETGGSGSDETGRGIGLDASGNVYITGAYYGTVKFDTLRLTSQGGYEAFLVKYNNNGTLQWGRSAGGAGFDSGYEIAINANNIYLTGYYTGSATFGSISKIGKGLADIFVAKYDNNGQCIWAQSAGGTETDYGHGIAVNSSGIVYATGYYSGTATFDKTVKTSQGGSDIFVMRFD